MNTFDDWHHWNRWITKKQLAGYLGFSERWVSRRVNEDGMPHMRMGGSLRFQLTQVEDWLREQDKSKNKPVVWWDKRPRS